MLKEADSSESDLHNRRIDEELPLRELRARHKALQDEIVSLRGRSSNLPQHMVALRARMSAAIGVEESELPFAGELIEVRQEAKDWEGAAERLLHGFALTLLVPARHYADVASWVNGNHLAGRLVYYRVDEDRVVVRTSRAGRHSLSEKLKLKSDTPLYDWLQREVDRRFDHVCCASLDQFRREAKAITREGQIKGDHGRHEKDDRHAITDRTRYVLGWSNAAKITALDGEARALEQPIRDAAAALASTIAETQSLRSKRDHLHKLSAIKAFADVDWSSIALEIADLEKERASLAEGSDILIALRARLDEAEASRRELAGKIENFVAEQASARQRRETLLERREAAEQEIEAHPVEDQTAARPQLDALRDEVLGTQKLTVENCEARGREIRDALQRRIESLDGRLKTLVGRLSSAMTLYKTAWPEDTKDMDASPEAADEYRRALKELEEEGLPRFETRFKQFLNENAIREVAGFQSKLREEERTIRERIDIINESLRDIEYQTGTYIELDPVPTTDIEVREFQQELRKCTENTLTGSDDDAYAEAKFLEVKRVIERFRGRVGSSTLDEKWTAKVTDVRNWFEFSACERWRADGAEKELYTDSGGKSGGQKEKLAYTILAASLAYQYGIETAAEHSRAFHFVMIDEAFGRGSDQAAEFGLELFRKMGFQLLIATPLQKIHVIEPYVASVGYVHKETTVEAEHSLLRVMTLEEFRREKALRRTAAQVPAPTGT